MQVSRRASVSAIPVHGPCPQPGSGLTSPVDKQLLVRQRARFYARCRTCPDLLLCVRLLNLTSYSPCSGTSGYPLSGTQRAVRPLRRAVMVREWGGLRR